MKRLLLLSTALIFAATMSMAAITADELVVRYQAQGYTRIEVKTGPTQIKVEAVMGNTKVEVIYDALSGEILKQETSQASGDDLGTGVELSIEDEDFLDGDDSNDDDSDSNDDSNDDSSDDGDDDSSDDSGNDDAGDDDSGSDDSDDGDDDSGSDND